MYRSNEPGYIINGPVDDTLRVFLTLLGLRTENSKCFHIMAITFANCIGGSRGGGAPGARPP